MLFLVIVVDLLLIFQMVMEFQLHRAKGGFPGKSTVIVPLRGEEPALSANAISILSQDHPDFRVIYVVDNDELEKQSALLNPFGVQTIETEELCKMCSGKIKAILTGIKHSNGNIVIADSDTVYPKSWLTVLTSMLKSYHVVTVFSWPYPLKITMKNLMRAGFWTLGFESQAIGGRFLWGGSMAFRESDMDQKITNELSGEWCDDCALTRISKKMGWKIGYAAQVMPLNAFNEKNLTSWTVRQVKLMLKYSKRGVYAFVVVALVLAVFLVMSVLTENWLYLTPFALWVVKNLARGRMYGRLAVLPSIMSLPAIFFALLFLVIGARSHSIRWRDKNYNIDG
ncbi:MAG: glycosyltransferase family 2 protein [Conexivisphaerales archaeon]